MYRINIKFIDRLYWSAANPLFLTSAEMGVPYILTMARDVTVDEQ